VSKRVRDGSFFYCPECGYSSFFRCKTHFRPPEGLSVDDVYRIKDAVFVKLIEEGKHKKMRYIFADRW